MEPEISILLPTYNPGKFLDQRLDSIFSQTFRNWELIIVDSQSTDGSEEVLRKLAESNPMVRFYERPRGLYEAWNFAVEQARGKYVYIATADDSMVPEALKTMYDALEEHPECDICDSVLKLIDENGREIQPFEPTYIAHHWHVPFLRDRKHIRFKPGDFYAHMGGKTIYTSVTQILIRRSLFKKTGLFSPDFGRSADYLWGMRAALNANVLFLPVQLATWRIHNQQVTWSNSDETINKNYSLMTEMAMQVLKECPPSVARKAKRISSLIHFKSILLPAKRSPTSFFEKARLTLCAFRRYPLLTIEFLLTLPLYYWRIPPSFVLIYTFDKMIHRHTLFICSRFFRYL